VYVLKGWLRFEYEGVGVITVKAGDCFVQPPNILHREIAHSKNMELIEVVAPANFRTLDGPVMPAPAKTPAKKAVAQSARK
jgi:quercetin dioxygenase-like cupin family protein